VATASPSPVGLSVSLSTVLGVVVFVVLLLIVLLLLLSRRRGKKKIVASAGANGKISPDGTVKVNRGSDQDFTITSDPHYHIADVLVDGKSIGAKSSYAFTNVKDDHTINATFKPE
jgi:hypothetical protein